MTEEKATNKTNKIAWIALALVFLLAAWLFYERSQLLAENTALKTKLEESNSEKTNVKNELAELLVEYEGMKTKDKRLNEQLQAEQEKIRELLEEVKNIKNSSAAQIARYKKEIKTLRAVMRSFVAQIDSLNTKNKQLTKQVRATQTKYKSAIEEKELLEEKRDSLSTQVALASTLLADAIECEAINKRGNRTSRARKTQKIKVCFTIRDNPVATQGTKKIYLRLADANGNIVLGSDYFAFQQNEKELAASAMREVFYNGKKTEACVYFIASDEMAKGTYSIDIFENSQLMGSTKIRLK